MNQRTILLTGSNGLTGQKVIYQALARPNIRLIATGRGANRTRQTQGYIYVPADLSLKAEVDNLFETYSPDAVIHTAAMTNVDACEQNPTECDIQNVEVVKHLVDASNRKGSYLIHLSTDFVFNGESGPYKEDDLPDPVSYYGLSKLKAEQWIQAHARRWAILRTILVYGVVDGNTRSNIVLWPKTLLEQGKEVQIVNDQFRMPTLAEDLAEACLLCAEKEAEGIFHISGDELMTPFDIVQRTARFFGLNPDLVKPQSSEALRQPAKRPPRTGFDLNKAKSILGYTPHSFEEGLRLVAQQLQAEAELAKA